MIFLGIDCGTQSTKVMALDWTSGEVLASGGDGYGFVAGLPEGAMEQDPAWWVAAADKGMREVVKTLGPRASEIRGIGVSGQQHGLVAIDKDGKVLRPAKLWCDTSTTGECAEITAALGGDQSVIARVGNTMRPGYTAPKMLWLRKNEPRNWDATDAFLLPHDYLNFWLTGEKRMEYGDASGTALLDIFTRGWSEEACAAIAPDLAAKLPPLGSSHKACGRLRRDLGRGWGLPDDVIVSAGGGDNMMAAIGTGNVKQGAVTASLGTSGTLFAFSEDPIVDPHGEVAAFCDSTDHWLPLVCTMNLTLVSEHVRKMFAWTFEEMDAAILSVAPGADGLTFLPYLTGERTPDLPKARGVLAGMTLSNFSPAHLARASVESVILGLGYGLQRFRELRVPVAAIRLTGGASNSPVWRQICADVFGVPVLCLDSNKGAALGAAIQAGWTLEDSCLADICERIIPESGIPQAEPRSHAVYQDLLNQTGQLRTSLTPFLT